MSARIEWALVVWEFCPDRPVIQWACETIMEFAIEREMGRVA